MATFDRHPTAHGVPAEKLSGDEAMENLRIAREDCQARCDHFHKNQPDAKQHNAWRRHATAIEWAIQRLTGD